MIGDQLDAYEFPGPILYFQSLNREKLSLRYQGHADRMTNRDIGVVEGLFIAMPDSSGRG